MLHNQGVMVWNVRGLNDVARRSVLRNLIIAQRPSLICIQETKLSAICNATAIEFLGPAYDYVYLPAVGVARGIALAWDREVWETSEISMGRFCVLAGLQRLGALPNLWRFVGVYGPQQDEEKMEFLSELSQLMISSPGPWLAAGDFNMIYRACDKNNDQLNRRTMRRFRAFLDHTHLVEIELCGRNFTWSNRRQNPTLVHLDRLFVNAEWLDLFPAHSLKALSYDCSDHCPLLLLLNAPSGLLPRFRFETFWPKVPGYDEVVASAWATVPPASDAFRLLD